MCIDLHPISTLYGLTLELEIELCAHFFIENHSGSVRYSIHATPNLNIIIAHIVLL
jgi:hypothetical protein